MSASEILGEMEGPIRDAARFCMNYDAEAFKTMDPQIKWATYRLLTPDFLEMLDEQSHEKYMEIRSGAAAYLVYQHFGSSNKYITEAPIHMYLLGPGHRLESDTTPVEDLIGTGLTRWYVQDHRGNMKRIMEQIRLHYSDWYRAAIVGE